MQNMRSQQTIDWDTGSAPEARHPENMPQTGLSAGFLNELILRTLYSRGGLLGLDLAKQLCLPFRVIQESLNFLKQEKTIEVLGGDLIGSVSYRFNLTDIGRRRAQESMKMCRYVGPAPVPLEDYVEQTYRQAVTAIDVSPEALRPPWATSSSTTSCSAPSGRPSSAASRCSSTARPATARRRSRSRSARS